MSSGTLANAIPLVLGCVSLMACADVDITDEPEAVVSARSAVSVIANNFWWAQGQAPTVMTPTASTICFITQIEGKFKGDGEAVFIDSANGKWRINGRSAQTGVLAAARCVDNIDLQAETTQEFKWNQATHSNGQKIEIKDRDNNSISPDDWSCFLTRMEGHFLGHGEGIRVRVSDGKWVMEGWSEQSGVVGGARCVKKPRRSSVAWYDHQSPVALPDPEQTDICYLMRVTGNLSNWGMVGTYRNGLQGSPWYLSGTNHLPDTQLGATASCLW